jgi:hypothetical protein
MLKDAWEIEGAENPDDLGNEDEINEAMKEEGTSEDEKKETHAHDSDGSDDEGRRRRKLPRACAGRRS